MSETGSSPIEQRQVLATPEVTKSQEPEQTTVPKELDTDNLVAFQTLATKLSAESTAELSKFLSQKNETWKPLLDTISQRELLMQVEADSEMIDIDPSVLTDILKKFSYKQTKAGANEIEAGANEIEAGANEIEAGANAVVIEKVIDAAAETEKNNAAAREVSKQVENIEKEFAPLSQLVPKIPADVQNKADAFMAKQGESIPADARDGVYKAFILLNVSPDLVILPEGKSQEDFQRALQGLWNTADQLSIPHPPRSLGELKFRRDNSPILDSDRQQALVALGYDPEDVKSGKRALDGVIRIGDRVIRQEGEFSRSVDLASRETTSSKSGDSGRSLSVSTGRAEYTPDYRSLAEISLTRESVTRENVSLRSSLDGSSPRVVEALRSVGFDRAPRDLEASVVVKGLEAAKVKLRSELEAVKREWASAISDGLSQMDPVGVGDVGAVWPLSDEKDIADALTELGSQIAVAEEVAEKQAEKLGRIQELERADREARESARMSSDAEDRGASESLSILVDQLHLDEIGQSAFDAIVKRVGSEKGESVLFGLDGPLDARDGISLKELRFLAKVMNTLAGSQVIRVDGTIAKLIPDEVEGRKNLREWLRSGEYLDKGSNPNTMKLESAIRGLTPGDLEKKSS